MLRDQMGLSPSTAAETLEAQILVHDVTAAPLEWLGAQAATGAP